MSDQTDRMQSALCIPQLLFALLVFEHSWVLSAVLIIDILIVRAPWKVPRFDRSGVSYWVETVLNILPMVVISIYIFIKNGLTFPDSGLLFHLILGILLGVLGVWISGFPLNSLIKGELASLMGPDRRSHISARLSQNLVAPLLEEVTYRVAPVLLAGPLFGVAAQVIFVLRHYLLRGGNELLINKAFIWRCVLSMTYLAIFIWSGSILIPVIAHLIQNLPNVLLEAQRFALSRSKTDAKR